MGDAHLDCLDFFTDLGLSINLNHHHHPEWWHSNITVYSHEVIALHPMKIRKSILRHDTFTDVAKILILKLTPEPVGYSITLTPESQGIAAFLLVRYSSKEGFKDGTKCLCIVTCRRVCLGEAQ